MFTAIDDDDEEIGTKMLLMVLRKYMAIGSAPVTDWKAEFNRKQGEPRKRDPDNLDICLTDPPVFIVQGLASRDMLSSDMGW